MILAVEIVVTIIEFHIVTLVAFVTVPFGVLTQTAFMSERAIGYVVSVGIKLMALAIVVSLGTTVFDNYTVSSDPGIGEDVGLLLGAVLMVMLALKIPAIAGGPDQRRPAAERRRRRRWARRASPPASPASVLAGRAAGGAIGAVLGGGRRRGRRRRAAPPAPFPPAAGSPPSGGGGSGGPAPRRPAAPASSAASTGDDARAPPAPG